MGVQLGEAFALEDHRPSLRRRISVVIGGR
jgi:hypothetical protein